jgi:hypothetical protein
LVAPVRDRTVLVESARGSVGDDEELLNHARRYFQAAAQSTERRKMQLLVKLGLEYLKLAAQMERARRRQRRGVSPGERPEGGPGL